MATRPVCVQLQNVLFAIQAPTAPPLASLNPSRDAWLDSTVSLALTALTRPTVQGTCVRWVATVPRALLYPSNVQWGPTTLKKVCKVMFFNVSLLLFFTKQKFMEVFEMCIMIEYHLYSTVLS